jgi:hypothetical protein
MNDAIRMWTSPGTEPEPHEVSACYDNLRRPGRTSPVLNCSCGFSASADTWEEAGYDFDHHFTPPLTEQG